MKVTIYGAYGPLVVKPTVSRRVVLLRKAYWGAKPPQPPGGIHISQGWCKWGVWGEGPGGPGSPHSCTAKFIFGLGPPQGARSHLKDGGAAGTSRLKDGKSKNEFRCAAMGGAGPSGPFPPIPPIYINTNLRAVGPSVCVDVGGP